jgi:hypothetical protein
MANQARTVMAPWCATGAGRAAVDRPHTRPSPPLSRGWTAARSLLQSAELLAAEAFAYPDVLADFGFNAAAE